MPPSPTPIALRLPASFPPTNTILFKAQQLPPPSQPPTLLLFLPGNPGLITYYTPFLTQLAQQHPSISILGASHAGFTPNTTSGRHDYELPEQVDLKRELLRIFVNECSRGGLRPQVLLIGHSMGCYISLSMLHAALDDDPGYDVVGGIMLFPTIVDIALSPSGKLLGGVLSSHFVREVLATSVYLISLLPAALVLWLVWGVTGMSGHAAEATRTLVTSPDVVRQALVLAASEMVTICADKWGDEVWAGGVEVAKEKGKKGKKGKGGLVFVFAEKDHWVADTTRAAILESRGEGVREMVVLKAKEGGRHGFCTDVEESKRLAWRCERWIEGILGAEEEA